MNLALWLEEKSCLMTHANLPPDFLNRTNVHVQMYIRGLTTTAASDCNAERQTPDHSISLPDLRSNKENTG